MAKCDLIYKIFPDASITTDIIVAFPTETEEDFLDTLDLVQKVNFYSVHFFVYSLRDGTVAARYQQINGVVAKEREQRLKTVVLQEKNKYLNKHFNEKLEMLTEDYDGKYTQGYSRNYVKCYLEEKVDGNQIINVVPYKIYNDGYIVRRILIWIVFFVKLSTKKYQAM